MCWIAPLIPQARYSSGVILVPVWPTCCGCGRQPSLVTTRDTPTTPPSSPASSSSGAKPSGPPTPRPPPTTTRALASETPPLCPADSAARTARSPSASSGWQQLGRRPPAAGRVPPARRRGTASVATVSSAGGAVQDRVLQQQAGPPLPDEPPLAAAGRPAGTAETQFAAIGRPVIAPRWASTSLPRSVAGRHHRGSRRSRLTSPASDPRPGQRRVPGQLARLDHVGAGSRRSRPASARAHRAASAEPGPASAAPAGQGPGEGQGAQRRVGDGRRRPARPGRARSRQHPQLVQQARPGRAPRPPRCRAPGLLPARSAAPAAPPCAGRPAPTAGSMLLDRRPLGPQPARQRRVARQVDALLDGDHRGQRRTRRPPRARGTPGRARDRPVADLDSCLIPVDAGPAERVRHPDAHLVVAGVGRLVAEQQQVVAGRRGRRASATIAAAVATGPHSRPSVSSSTARPRAERQRVAQLVGGRGGPEGQHRSPSRRAAR